MVALTKPIRLRRWLGGINNVADQTDLLGTRTAPIDYLRDAVNIDLDSSGKPAMRPGYRLLAGGRWHSAWSEEGMTTAFAVRDGVLVLLRSYGGTVESTPLAEVGNDPVSYTYMNGEVYWSNPGAAGVTSLDGRVRDWGLPQAPPPLASASATGGLLAGTYRVSMTYRNAQGEESGASESISVEVAAGGGILVQTFWLPEGCRAVLYRSEVNGGVLYQAGTTGVGALTLGAGTVGRQLDTQFMEQMPTGRIVRAYRGRIYMALDGELSDTLVYSRPLRYGLYKPTEDYVRMGAPISFVEPVDGGLYVGTRDRTYFLAGDDPTKFQQVPVDLYGAVPYASMRCMGSNFGDDVSGTVAVWWNQRGHMAVGTGTGGVLFPTKERFTMPAQAEGFVGLREYDGAHRVVAMFRKAGNSSGFGARDFADAQIVRNGIVLPEPTVLRGIAQDRFRVADAVDAV